MDNSRRPLRRVAVNFVDGGSLCLLLALLVLCEFESGVVVTTAFMPTTTVVPFLSTPIKRTSFTRASTVTAYSTISPNEGMGTADDQKKPPVGTGKTIVVAGATGYIGRAVVRESIRQGYNTIALVRDIEKAQANPKFSALIDTGAVPIQCDVTNYTQVVDAMQCITEKFCSETDSATITAVVSCLASRSGVKKDAYLIDFGATNHCLKAGIATQTQHFILLSAFCVQKPILQFQQGKFRKSKLYLFVLGWLFRPTTYRLTHTDMYMHRPTLSL
jgi:NAD(P)H-binding